MTNKRSFFPDVVGNAYVGVYGQFILIFTANRIKALQIRYRDSIVTQDFENQAKAAIDEKFEFDHNVVCVQHGNFVILEYRLS